MSKPVEALPAHPVGEQSSVECLPEEVGLCADTFGGRVHVEWDPTAAATPLGQLPFFVEFLKLGGLFDPWVADCPLMLRSPNAPAKRDILGTLLLAVLAGHQRYAHITALRGDKVNAVLLGMGPGDERGFGPPGAGEDRRGGWHGLAAAPPRLYFPAVVRRAVDPRRGYHGQAAVRSAGGRGGRLQSAQAGPAVAHLPHLCDCRVPADAGGGGPGRQPACVEAFGAGVVGVAGADRPRGLAAAGARRLRLGNRGEHEPGGTGGIALPVQAAANAQRQAADRAGDGGAGLDRCRSGLAG